MVNEFCVIFWYLWATNLCLDPFLEPCMVISSDADPTRNWLLLVYVKKLQKLTAPEVLMRFFVFTGNNWNSLFALSLNNFEVHG